MKVSREDVADVKCVHRRADYISTRFVATRPKELSRSRDRQRDEAVTAI